MTSDRARPVYTWWNVVHLRNEGLAAGQQNKKEKRINKTADENNRCVRSVRSRHVSSITKCASTIVKSNVTGQASDYSQSAPQGCITQSSNGKKSRKKENSNRPARGESLELCDGRSLQWRRYYIGRQVRLASTEKPHTIDLDTIYLFSFLVFYYAMENREASGLSVLRRCQRKRVWKNISASKRSQPQGN